MYPQLYGSFHADTPFLEEFGKRIDGVIEWTIFSPEQDSDRQRTDIAKCHIFLASRYHPQIFAAQAGVPGICLAYEHKMSGFMQQVGMEDYCFSIEKLEEREVISALERILSQRETLSQRIHAASLELHKTAKETASIGSALALDSRHDELAGGVSRLA